MKKSFSTSSTVLVTTLAAALVCLPLLSSAQEGPERPKRNAGKIELLEQQVDKLMKEMGDLVGAEAPDQIRAKAATLQNKLDELATKIAEASEAASNEANAASGRDERLNDLGDEVKKLWEENAALKKDLDEVKAAQIAGYDNGFYIASPDGKFRLTINAYAKPFYKVALQQQWETDSYGQLEYESVTGPNGTQLEPKGGDLEATKHELGISSARLIFSAKFLGVLKGKFAVDFGKFDGGTSYPTNSTYGMAEGQAPNMNYNKVKINQYGVRYIDAYGEFAPMREFSIRAGQFKVPFDRETLVSSGRLMFTSRSLMTGGYYFWGDSRNNVSNDELAAGWPYESVRGSSFGYDRGVQASGIIAEGMFNYALGVFSGGGINRGNDNEKFLTSVRVWTDPLGKMTSGMSDLDSSAEPLLSVGAAFAYGLPQNSYYDDPGSSSASYYSEDVSLTADALFKWMGISAMGSFFFRNSDHGGTLPDSIKSTGYLGQVAYYYAPWKVEPAFRYSMYEPNLDRRGDNVHEFTGALNYYPYGDSLKVKVEYRGLFPNDTQKSYFMPDGGWYDYLHEITIQAQIGF